MEVKSLINKLNCDVNHKCNGKRAAIQTKEESAHSKIINLLEKEEASFHTYARKNEVNSKIILKGLPVIPTDIIKDEILSYQITPISIFMLRANDNYNVNQATYL